MKNMDESTLRRAWLLFKNGTTKQRMAELLKCSEQEAEDAVQLASDLFGRGPYKKIVSKPDVILNSARPKDEYSNSGYLNTVKKYS